jgi:uncharacterized protein
MNNMNEILFADAAIETLEANKTLPSKFKRMLKKSSLPKKTTGKNVVIKMHFGSEIGFTTIHPVFVRTLVEFVKDSGAKSVKVMDSRSPMDGLARGYTEEVLGCPVVNCLGENGDYLKAEKIGFKGLDEALLGGIALDGDLFIDLSHVKGHGDCGFGGALKNIAMGVVPTETRRKLHQLEGGIEYDPSKCTFCIKCYNSCPREAIILNKEKKKISFFFHHCTYCQHCVMACPEGAIKMENRKFEDFSRGMALVTSAFLKKFTPDNLFYINFLTNITIYCDCWGFSSPSLVPDIGILVGDDIAAIETASLDLIKTENLLPNGLPKDRPLGEGKHLFEKIHAKDPYLMIKFLEEYYDCSSEYELKEVK